MLFMYQLANLTMNSINFYIVINFSDINKQERGVEKKVRKMHPNPDG